MRTSNSCRRVAAGTIAAGAVAGALLIGATPPAQAAPAGTGTTVPAVVQLSDAPLGPQPAIDHVQPGVLPQWWGHHWWHPHHWWRHWWWWW